MTNISGPLIPVQRQITNYGKADVTPATDQVIDLGTTNPEALQTELNTTDALFLRMTVDGQEQFFDISALETPEERQELIDTLKAHILDDNGQVDPDFNAANFFSTVNGTIQFGGGAQGTELTESYVANAEDVVTASNEREDQVWDAFNGEHETLNAPESGKPDEWYRGFVIEGENVSVNRDNVETSIDTLPEYREMLVQDFNFNQALNTFTAMGEPAGQEAFVASIQQQYPNHALSQDDLAELAENIYSYATTGADASNPDGLGNTDIAQMQGMLYALDSEIVSTSDSNTNMQAEDILSADAYNALPDDEKSNYFQLGDSFLPLGDGIHGRATILTTRHLMSNIESRDIEPVSLDVQEYEPLEPNYATRTLETMLERNGDGHFLVQFDFSASMADEWPALMEMFNPANPDNIMLRYPNASFAFGVISDIKHADRQLMMDMSNDPQEIYRTLQSASPAGTQNESALIPTVNNIMEHGVFDDSGDHAQIVLNFTDEPDHGAHLSRHGVSRNVGERSTAQEMDILLANNPKLEMFYINPPRTEGGDEEIVNYVNAREEYSGKGIMTPYDHVQQEDELQFHAIEKVDMLSEKEQAKYQLDEAAVINYLSEYAEYADSRATERNGFVNQLASAANNGDVNAAAALMFLRDHKIDGGGRNPNGGHNTVNARIGGAINGLSGVSSSGVFANKRDVLEWIDEQARNIQPPAELMSVLEGM